MSWPLQLAFPWGLVLLAGLPWIYLHARDALPSTAGAARLHLWARLMVATLLVLAAGGLAVRIGDGGRAVVFVLDRSDSVPQDEQSRSVEHVRRAVGEMEAADRAGLVVFGHDAVIERALAGSLDLESVRSRVEPGATDLAAALATARRLLSEEPVGRIVLLSDGNETSGTADVEAALARARGIPIDVVPLATDADALGGEVLIAEVAAPPRVRLGEPFEIGVGVLGAIGAPIEVTLRRDDVAAGRATVAPTADGRGSATFRQRLSEPGLYRFTAMVDSPADIFPVNNQGSVLVHAEGRATLACLCRPADVEVLTEILGRRDIAVTFVDPASPTVPSHLGRFDAVLLDDLPAEALTERQMEALAAWVEVEGGGLLMTGAVGSFGPGGYGRTPIETALPVEMTPTDRKAQDRLALVLLLDKSGSMASDEGGVPKLTRGKEAARSLVELLAPNDQFGVIAFDDMTESPIDLQLVGESRLDLDPLFAVEAGGGTAIEPAIREAYALLEGSRAQRRHVLLLSDGQGETGRLDALESLLGGSDVVLSAVGIGDDVDRSYLTQLAEMTSGRVYFTPAAADLAEIFAREALVISGRYLIAGTVRPEATAAHPILEAVDTASLPTIGGYVAATTKPTAQVLMTVEGDAPLLAAWRHGMGRAAVLTTDLSSPWTADLLRWEGFDGFWTQLVRWTQRRLESESLQPSARLEGSDIVLAVDAFDAGNRFAEALAVRADVTDPAGEPFVVQLTQIAAGRYEGRFEAAVRGIYRMVIRAAGTALDGEQSVFLGFDASTLPEYKKIGADLARLDEIARLSGGELLSGGQGPFDAPAPPPVYKDLTRPLILIATLLFLIDLVARRRLARRSAINWARPPRSAEA